MGRPHDVPTAAELVEAVREWVQRTIVDPDSTPTRFHARVAANVLSMVERELELGADHDRAHADRLAQLGVVDDAELARAIREGRMDDRLDQVRELVWDSVRDKLAVARPGYLDRVEPP